MCWSVTSGLTTISYVDGTFMVRQDSLMGSPAGFEIPEDEWGEFMRAVKHANAWR